VFGLPVDNVVVHLGDSTLPRAGVTGGSRMANVMTAAVHKAALALRDELIGLGINHPASPFRSLQANTLAVANGRIASLRDAGPDIPISEFLAAIGLEKIEAVRDTLAENRISPDDRFKNYTTIAMALSPTDGDYSLHSWCAHFVEVRVDEDFGTVRVSRVVSALDSGRLYNPKLAESQWKGGIIMGIGQALLEEGIVDRRHARVLNNNLADYLVHRWRGAGNRQCRLPRYRQARSRPPDHAGEAYFSLIAPGDPSLNWCIVAAVCPSASRSSAAIIALL
jgi:xanthine dehydrogenase YagR molybdenum-binding subunit